MPRIVCPSIVGRREEAARLDGAVDATLAGRGGVVLVAGPAGIGKSRLAAGAVARARSLGIADLMGRAVPAEVPAPYRPLGEALVAASRSGWRPDTPALRGFAVALGHLVPDWRESASDLADESPVLVAEALLRVLRTLAAGTACLLVVEDLHWADPESLAAIEYLADHAAELPVLCIGTLRDDPRTPATEAAARLEARRAVEVIRLGPLGAAEVSAMARDCLGAATLPDEVEALLRDGAEGVPFFVEELLAAAAADGALVPAAAGWSVTGPIRPLVPLSFAETVGRRLADAGDELRRLLGIAALLGRQVDWRLVTRAAGRAPSDTHELLGRAVELQLLATGGGEVTFRHALTREAILRELLPSERAELAARCLAAVEDEPPAGQEWRHLAADLAEASGEPDRAAAHLLAAGRGSLSRGALATATTALTRAARLTAAPALRADVQEALAMARSAAGDLHGTQEAVDALLATLDGMGAPPGRRGQAHLLVARSATAATHLEIAREELARARRLGALDGDGALGARVTAVAAELALLDFRVGEAEVLATRAVDDAFLTGQFDVVCEALEVAGRCARTRDLDEAEARFTRALIVAEDHGLTLWRMRALYQLGTVDLLRGGALDRLEQAREVAVGLGALATVAHIDLEVGAGREITFRLEEARAALGRCIEMASLLGLRRLEAIAHCFVGVIEAERGARRRMEEALGRALALGDDDGDLVGAVWGDARAVASLGDEDRARALRELDTAVAAFAGRRAVVPRPSAALRELVAALEGAGPDPTAGSGATAELYQSRAYLEGAAAVRHGRSGRGGEAEACRVRADALLARSPWYRHLMLRLCAEAAIADGWGDPVTWATEAARFFEGAGNERLASACRTLLRRAGGHVSRPTRAARRLPAALRDAGVTAREAEVLGLVGQGLSNAEIGRRLFLSERTVEHHVGCVRRKLGLESRAQMIAYALNAPSR